METNLFTSAAAKSNASGTNGAVQSNGSTEQDMFTKLLVAQIQNQDPLSPQDPSQFVQQLTQLSQTESLKNLANLTQENLTTLTSMQVLAMGAQVGSNVMASTDTVKLAGDTVKGEITLTAASAKTQLVLTDSGGKETTIDLGTQSPGGVPFSIDPASLHLSDGSYKMKVVTSDGQQDTAIDIAGRLNSVRLVTGGAVLSVSNIGDVSAGQITVFNGRSRNSNSAAAAAAAAAKSSVI
jgi:flagellar basal-body rod modification protein FlgD